MKRLIVIGARATGGSLALVRGALARQVAVTVITAPGHSLDGVFPDGVETIHLEPDAALLAGWQRARYPDEIDTLRVTTAHDTYARTAAWVADALGLPGQQTNRHARSNRHHTGNRGAAAKRNRPPVHITPRGNGRIPRGGFGKATLPTATAAFSRAAHRASADASHAKRLTRTVTDCAPTTVPATRPRRRSTAVHTRKTRRSAPVRRSRPHNNPPASAPPRQPGRAHPQRP